MKIHTLFAVSLMAFALTACGGKKDKDLNKEPTENEIISMVEENFKTEFPDGDLKLQGVKKLECTEKSKDAVQCKINISVTAINPENNEAVVQSNESTINFRKENDKWVSFND